MRGFSKYGSDAAISSMWLEAFAIVGHSNAAAFVQCALVSGAHVSHCVTGLLHHSTAKRVGMPCPGQLKLGVSHRLSSNSELWPQMVVR